VPQIAGKVLLVRDLDEHVCVTRLIKRAVASEVTATEFVPDVLDRDCEAPGQ